MENKKLSKEKHEAIVAQPVELAALGEEVALCLQTISGPCEIKTCRGDIRLIVDALRDYARILRTVCIDWELDSYTRGMYEIHAYKLERIAEKYQAGIGYDYDKALELCKKKKRPTTPDSGIDAL